VHERRHPIPPAEAAPQRRDAARAGWLAVGPEHGGDGLAVPELLEGPDRQERRQVRVAVGGRHEQIPEVADRVVLDVVHVAQAPKGGVVERVGAEGIEVDPLELDPARMALVGLEVQLHDRISSSRSPWMGLVTRRAR
jgi:hypothetical protein